LLTSSPAAGEAGGVAPCDRRIITPVTESEGGLAHDKAIELAVGTALVPVTGPGTALAFAYQPATSATSWTVPPEPLYRETFPPAPTGTTTMFEVVWAATKFRLDAVGGEPGPVA